MKIIRFLLFPFAIIFWLITYTRNKLFDLNILKSVSFELPIICIGNLRVGGTGKTPMVEFLLDKFKNDYKIATLSRGYGRETEGFIQANENSNSREIGDEPLQLYRKFKDVAEIFVCEDRVLAVPEILRRNENINLILLDDAFQHRFIKARINILLTSYDKIFYKDFILPSGLLRESPYGARRADIIVVTKCPIGLKSSEKERITKRINFYSGKEKQVYFSSIKYSEPCTFDHNSSDLKGKVILLVTGLANPSPFIDHVMANFKIGKEMHFKDHYDYYSDDIDTMIKWLDENDNGALLCTEKDYVKLGDKRFETAFKGKDVNYIAIENNIDREEEFIDLIKTGIK